MSIKNITSPEEFFGKMPGSDRFLISWDKLCAYYRLLESESPCVKVTSPGKTTEGNEFLIVYVSSEENLKNLDKYSKISKKLATDETLTEEEIKRLSAEGKAVVFESYSLHSNEVGGSQSVPLIIYDMISAEPGSELYEAMQNVILILSPCSEPDGLIKFHDYYYKYYGTRFEGFCSPYLRHKLAGHCNNRDAFHEKAIESRYLNDIIIRGWCPQMMIDYHHSYPHGERMSIAPSANPLFPYTSSLLVTEDAVSGATMARDLMAAGRTGVVSGDLSFNDFPINTFYGTARLHNINGMLAENADVRIATPIYVHPSRCFGTKFPTSQCPRPWKGGEWHLSDIVTNIKIASLSLVKHANLNKQNILSNMALKAKMQSERGLEDDRNTFLIPREQYDTTALNNLLRLLQNHEIRVYETKKEIFANGRIYPAGTYAVPLSQPKYAFIIVALDRASYPINKFCENPDGSIKVSDNANLSVSVGMGVECIPANEKIFLGDLVPCGKIEEYVPTFPMSAKENVSYFTANKYLANGTKIYRDAEGNFHDSAAEGRYEVRRARVAVYDRGDSTGNLEEGFTNNFLNTYGFDWCNITDKEIRENEIPENIDAIIFAGDKDFEIGFGDTAPDYAPVEYQTGIGAVGLEHIKKFMSRGGKVISWERSNVYFNKAFELNMADNVAGLDIKQFAPHGSQINYTLTEEACDLTLGMPAHFNAIFNNGSPALYPTDIVHRCKVYATVAKENILNCGFMVGEKLLSEIPAIIRHEYDNGELIMYAFNPVFRCQQDTTYKVLANALFIKCEKAPDRKTVHYVTHYEIPTMYYI